MHSRYKEVNKETVRCQHSSDKCYGGFARVRAAVKSFTEKAEKKGMPTLYLDAGDVFQETVYYTEFKWKLAVKMMNLLKPQAMSLGNHEFDDGVEGLAPYLERLNVPVVCCNIDKSQEPRLQVNEQLKPSIVITIGKPPKTARIGIVGYLTQQTKKLGKAKILDEIESLQSETQRLREGKNVDIIIALGHSGYDVDQKIAKAVGNIDVIVGGHSHTFLYNGKPPTDNKARGPYPTFVTPDNNKEKKIPIVQASYGTKYLGYLELEFDDNWKLVDHKGLPVLLTGKMEQDQEVLDALKPEADIIAKKYQINVGYTEFTLKGKGAYCRFVECNIGDMIADAFVDHVNTNYQTDNGEPVTIGLIHSGAIKGSLFAKTEKGFTGEIALEDVLQVLPFGCSLEVLNIKGSDLRTVLESSMDNYDPNDKFNPKMAQSGLFKADLIQVSGLKVKYDLTKEKGHRVVSLKVKAGPTFSDLDDNAFYNVVMPDYLAQGNTYKILTYQKRVVAVDKEEKDYKVVESFIKKQKKFKKRGKYYRTEGRISIRAESTIKSWYRKLMNFIGTLNPFNGLYG